jgi:hypothetical protein
VLSAGCIIAETGTGAGACADAVGAVACVDEALCWGIPLDGTCAAKKEQGEKKVAAAMSTRAMRIGVPSLEDSSETGF